MSESEQQPEGWYPHPTDPDKRVWWTGAEWGPVIDINELPPPVMAPGSAAEASGQSSDPESSAGGCCGPLTLIFIALMMMSWLLR